MKVGDRLPCIGSAIDYQPIAIGGNVFFRCNFLGNELDRTEHCRILRRYVIRTGYMLFGYDEDMYRRLRGYIPKGQNLIVLKYDLRWDLLRNDLAENAVHMQYKKKYPA